MAKIYPSASLPPFPALVTLLSLLSALAAFPSGRIAGGGRSFRDLLRSHGLPAGLLPRAVESFALDNSTGLLQIQLRGPCYASYDGGLAYFDSVVRANLSYGELGGVVGWSQEELFVWLPVKGILVADPSSGVILFDIGLAHKQLPASVFEDPPDCQPDAEAVRVVDKSFLGEAEMDSGSRDDN